MQVVGILSHFILMQVVNYPPICLGHPFNADFVMSETLLTHGVPSMYGTATCVPNDTSFIGDGKVGERGVFKTKPITITTETFVISKPEQRSFPPKYNLASQVFIIDVCSSSFDLR